MQTETNYIIKDQIRIGFFQNQQDAKEAMQYCKQGYITSHTKWQEEK